MGWAIRVFLVTLGAIVAEPARPLCDVRGTEPPPWVRCPSPRASWGTGAPVPGMAERWNG